MASSIGGNMIFGKLSHDLKLMATEHLNYDEKFKLVDIFPPVTKYIRIFDMNRHNVPIEQFPGASQRVQTASQEWEHFDNVIEQFGKLTNVTKIVMPSERDAEGFHKLDEAVVSSKNLNIEQFYWIHNHSCYSATEICEDFEHFGEPNIKLIIEYITNAKNVTQVTMVLVSRIYSTSTINWYLT